MRHTTIQNMNTRFWQECQHEVVRFEDNKRHDKTGTLSAMKGYED